MFLFIIAILVFIAIEVACAETENAWLGLGGVLIFVGILHYFFGLHMLHSLTENVLVSFLVLVGYFIAGGAYTVIWRYPDFLRKKKDKIIRDYHTFLNAGELENTSESFDKFTTSSFYDKYAPKENLNSITTWVTLWPFAAGWELSHRPVIWLYKKIYKTIGELLERITRNIIRKTLGK